MSRHPKPCLLVLKLKPNVWGSVAPRGGEGQPAVPSVCSLLPFPRYLVKGTIHSLDWKRSLGVGPFFPGSPWRLS